MTETAPGRLETHRPMASMNSMPQPMTRSVHASSPSGIKNIERAAAGIDDEAHDRHGKQISEHGIVGCAVEMVDRERNGRDASDQTRRRYAS